MKSNTLIIAAAGSGKTTYLANKACELTNQRILVTTYTESNEAGIKSMIIKKKGFIPSHITVQTWFSFLLQHGVRPYQSVLDESLHNENIGFYLTEKKSGARTDGNGKPLKNKEKKPIYWGEEDAKKHYFTSTLKIYSDKLSKFVCHSNEKSEGKVIKRISDIFDYVFIDEVQDLAGYDLAIIKLLFQSNASVLLVGDPRQVTYLTHHSAKFGKYSEGQIKNFVEQELNSKIMYEIDETTLNLSHRNNQTICDYSARLYPSLPRPIACSCQECRGNMSAHEGIFLVRRMDVEKYLSDFKPMQLRWSSSTKCNDQYPAQNFGESKGLTFERVLIYPTGDMIQWVKDHTHSLKNSTRAKLYVGLTRARRSTAIIMDYKDGDTFDGLVKYPISIQPSLF